VVRIQIKKKGMIKYGRDDEDRRRRGMTYQTTIASRTILLLNL
jgi:hypothetical protein